MKSPSSALSREREALELFLRPWETRTHKRDGFDTEKQRKMALENREIHRLIIKSLRRSRSFLNSLILLSVATFVTSQ